MRTVSRQGGKGGLERKTGREEGEAKWGTQGRSQDFSLGSKIRGRDRQGPKVRDLGVVLEKGQPAPSPPASFHQLEGLGERCKLYGPSRGVRTSVTGCAPSLCTLVTPPLFHALEGTGTARSPRVDRAWRVCECTQRRVLR